MSVGKFKYIYIFLVVWQFYFSDNAILRFYPYLFWPILAIIALVDQMKERRTYINKTDILFVLSFLVCILSSFFSPMQKDAWLFILEIVLYFISARYVARKKEFKYTYRLLLVFSLFHAAMVILQRFVPGVFAGLLYLLAPGNYQEVLYQAQNGIYMGLTGQTSTLSIYLMIGLVMSFVLMKEERFTIWNILLVMLFLLSILQTNRRGTFVCACVVSILFLLFARIKTSAKFLFLIFVLFSVLMIGISNIPGINELYEKTMRYSESTDFFSNRSSYWTRAVPMIQANSLLGYGLMSFTHYIPEAYPTAHNSYIQKVFELGIIGGFVFFLPYIYCLLRSFAGLIQRNRFLDSGSYQRYFTGFMMLVYMFLNSVTEGVFETPALFVMIFLTCFLIPEKG